MSCVAWCSKKKSILFLVVPPASCVHFPLIAGANGKFIIYSYIRLEVQIQTYTNIEKSRFLLTPNLRMLDFFWHLPPTTTGVSIQPFFEATGHSRLSRARALEPLGGSAAAPRRRRPGPPRGCRRLGASGFSTSVASGRLRKLREKIRQKNDIKRKKKRPKIGEPWLLDSNFGLFVWPNCERSIQIQWQFTVFSCGLLFWCHLWCAKCTIGMWRRCVYQTWGKRLY